MGVYVHDLSLLANMAEGELLCSRNLSFENLRNFSVFADRIRSKALRLS